MFEEEGSSEEWMGEGEGQLAIDVYQTDSEIVVRAPLAGVKAEDLEVGITDEMVTISGVRRPETEIPRENYLTAECYWGPFGRQYILPVAVAGEKAEATLKNGILTIRIPKLEASKKKVLQVKLVE